MSYRMSRVTGREQEKRTIVFGSWRIDKARLEVGRRILVQDGSAQLCKDKRPA